MTSRSHAPQLAVAFAALALAFPHAGLAQKIKLGTLAPKGSPWQKIIRDMADGWKTATAGKVTFLIYDGGVVGDEPDMVRKMRIGQLQAASLTGVGLSDIVPDVQALQMPMVIRSYDELDYVIEHIAPTLEAKLEAKGFKVLNWGDAGWVHFFSQSPVVTPTDLKPQKLFVWSGDTAYIEAYKDAGYQPVPLPSTEIHSGLQSGLVNAFSTTPLAALSFQWFGAAKNMVDLDWAPLIGATVITTAAWDKLPADAKPALLAESQRAGARVRAETRKLGVEAVETMKKYGLEVHAVPADARRQWQEMADKAGTVLVGRVVPADTMAEVKKLVAEYRSQKK